MNIRLLFLVLLAATVSRADPALEKEAAAWLEGLGEKGLVLNEKSDTPLVGQRIAGRKASMLVFRQEGWYLTLGFDGVVKQEDTLQNLRKNLKYVALDQLPTPGLARAGWRITPRTPISSFKKGVTLLGYEGGRLRFRVQTEFFALGGSDTRVLVPADAAAPAGSYFQIRKPFKLDLTLEAPLKAL